MRISDWSSVVCSSDLKGLRLLRFGGLARDGRGCGSLVLVVGADDGVSGDFLFDLDGHDAVPGMLACVWGVVRCRGGPGAGPHPNPSPASQERGFRSEEHTSELQSLMRISYAAFCLKNNT